MAIEGPLRELGIHDVFSLLDLSRKTGTLSVSSELRDDEGVVFFDGGRVVHASVRSNPTTLGESLMRSGKIGQADLATARSRQGDGEKRLGDLLVETGAITSRELERQVRLQIEAVVFELMSWREGFFRFEERNIRDAPAEASIRISTDSLLMEGARRIDEWSQIADKVPHLGVVPVLAPVNEDHPTLLDLLPNEWSVLGAIDGERDLRGLASVLGRSEFDVAKIVYGLVTTGVVELRAPDRVSASVMLPSEDAGLHVARAEEALSKGHLEEALSAARLATAADPKNALAHLAAGRALARLGRHADAADELHRALQADPLDADIHRVLAASAARRGDLREAIGSWESYLRLRPDAHDRGAVRDALAAAERLREYLDGATGV